MHFFQFSCTVLPAFFVVNTLQGILRNSVYPLDGTLVELFLAVNKERHFQPQTALNRNNEPDEEVKVTSPHRYLEEAITHFLLSHTVPMYTFLNCFNVWNLEQCDKLYHVVIHQ